MTESNIKILQEDLGSKGRYVAHIDGHEDTGELTFSKAGATMIIVDHTGVPDTLRGLGVGKALAAKAVGDARASGVKIIPLCPFFKAQALKHPEWQDVVNL